MKIFKGQYGFSTSAFSKNAEDGTENKLYINVQFKKGTEPIGKETIEGKLFFRNNEGEERECFLSSYKKKDGTVSPKLIIMEPGYKHIGNFKTSNKEQTIKEPILIDDDELPFY